MSVKANAQFYNLTPNEVMDALDGVGFYSTGEYFQLNSYENRVFDVKLEEPIKHSEWGELNRVIVKFYRPGRWSEECIQEEHDFLQDLAKQEFPVAAPLLLNSNQSMVAHNKMWMSVFPKIAGRMPQELNQDEFVKIGRSLAHMHSCGEQKGADHRPVLTAENYGWQNLELIEPWIAPEVRGRYIEAAESLLTEAEDLLEPNNYIRIHGDCHLGNLLLTDQLDKPKQFFFVDFDDFCMGPVAQDFWLLFSGEDRWEEEFNWLLTGYEELRQFPKDQAQLFKPLRGLRIIHYAAWIARRWEDPSFPRLFPNFKDYTYWAEETEALERIAWC